MSEKIVEALKKLDPKVDSFWTQEGLVNLNAFKFTLGESATREDLEAAWPGFNREVAAQSAAAPKTEGSLSVGENTITVTDDNDIRVKLAPLAEALKANVDTEDTPDGDNNLNAIIRFLRQPAPDFSTLSDEELKEYSNQAGDIRNSILSARNEFENLVGEGLHTLNKLTGEVQKRTPVETIAEQVKRIHEANAGQQFDIDKGRQRVVQPIPPLVRK